MIYIFLTSIINCRLYEIDSINLPIVTPTYEWGDLVSYNIVHRCSEHGPLTRYLKLRVAHAPGMPERFPRHRLQRKPLVSDHSMHHGTCVTHVQWCMSGPLTRCGWESVPGIPGACATRNFAYLARGPWCLFWMLIEMLLLGCTRST